MSSVRTDRTDLDSYQPHAGTAMTELQPPAAIPEQQHSSIVSLQTQQQLLSSANNDLYGVPQTRSIAQTTADQAIRLSRANAAITQVLQRQPDFRTALNNALRDALGKAFPELSKAADPGHIYLTHYRDTVIDPAAGDPVSERIPILSMSLSETLWHAMDKGLTPADDTVSRGFFHAPGNAINGPAEEVAAMNQATHPALFETVLESIIGQRLALYQKALKNYWNERGDTPASLSNKTTLVRAYTAQRQAEAQLRTGDGTLTAAASGMLDSLFGTSRADPQAVNGNPPGTFALSMLGSPGTNPIWFSGILLLTSDPGQHPDTATGPVLLLIPGQGLREFTDAATYRAALKEWFDDPEQRATLLSHVAQEDRARVGDPGDIRYDTISGNVFVDRIASMLHRQQRDVISTSSATLAAGRDPTPANDLKDLFETGAIALMRQQMLVEKFLENVSTADQMQWQQELMHYQKAVQATRSSGLPSMQQYLDPDFLTRYARDRVSAQIKSDLGLDLDPDQLTVTTYRYFEHRGPIPAPTRIEKRPYRQTLSVLALDNTSSLGDAGWNGIKVNNAAGEAQPQLTHAYLTQMLRTVDIGHHYAGLLQTHLLDSAEGQARERQYARFLAAQLQLDAREACIRGDISASGMRWVHAALSGTPVHVDQQSIQAQQLSVGNCVLNDVLLFGTQGLLLAGHPLRPVNYPYADNTCATNDAAKVVLYTPDAPDGKRLREFANREQMRREFINQPAMHNYLVQQTNLAQQAVVSTLLKQGAGNSDITASLTSGNFLHAAYRRQAQKIIANADARTISNTETDHQERWNKIRLAFDIAGIFLPAKMTVPISLMRAAIAVSDIREALRRDEKEAAWQAFFEGLGHVSGAALDKVRSIPVSKGGPKLVTAGHRAGQAPDGNTPVTTTKTNSPSATPAGMSGVQIDGNTYYYWQSNRNTVNYRDLFEMDPRHPGQLRAAGYGAPDKQQVWHKISLSGGGIGEQPSVPARITVPASEVAPNFDVQHVIRKMSSPATGTNYLAAKIDGKLQRLVYDFQGNVFTDINGNRYFPNENKMVRLHPLARRMPSNNEREAALRALGINLRLPMDFSTPATPLATPIPRLIHSVWIGGEIPPSRLDAILSSLENNALKAKNTPDPYEMKLYLSNRDQVAYAKNLFNIRTRAPAVNVAVLENTPFFQRFRESKYFTQYMAAIDGNDGVAINYSSAADVLRYRLLYHEGGLYLDCDDTLRVGPGAIDLHTTAAGLALGPPVSSIALGMDTQYNTSIFGSHKNNPTLDAISEESYRRFLAAPGLYKTARPKRLSSEQQRSATQQQNLANKQLVHAYMQRISHVTGPAVFNQVIDKQLPDMRQLREAIKLKNNIWNFRLSHQLKSQISTLENNRLPLGKINDIGNAHTWNET